MTKILLIIAMLLLIGCSGIPAKRDTAYYAAAIGTIADGYSTDYSLSNNPCAYEGGFVASRITGKHPNSRQIAGYTAARLGLLEWSRYWGSLNYKVFKWATISISLYVVPNNYKVGNLNCQK